MDEMTTASRREVILGALLAAGGLAAPRTADARTPALQEPTGDIRDFDYHVGRWTAVQRRMRQRWTDRPEWDEFPSISVYTSHLGGLVSIDETLFPTKSWAGVTVRAFNRERRQWFVYWISSRDGVLGTPMIGGFEDNRALFHGDDMDGDIPIKVRFIRLKQPPDRERWEQAFSRDGGTTWETNWTADFTRVRG